MSCLEYDIIRRQIQRLKIYVSEIDYIDDKQIVLKDGTILRLANSITDLLPICRISEPYDKYFAYMRERNDREGLISTTSFFLTDLRNSSTLYFYVMLLPLSDVVVGYSKEFKIEAPIDILDRVEQKYFDQLPTVLFESNLADINGLAGGTFKSFINWSVFDDFNRSLRTRLIQLFDIAVFNTFMDKSEAIYGNKQPTPEQQTKIQEALNISNEELRNQKISKVLENTETLSLDTVEENLKEIDERVRELKANGFLDLVNLPEREIDYIKLLSNNFKPKTLIGAIDFNLKTLLNSPIINMFTCINIDETSLNGVNLNDNGEGNGSGNGNDEVDVDGEGDGNGGGNGNGNGSGNGNGDDIKIIDVFNEDTLPDVENTNKGNTISSGMRPVIEAITKNDIALIEVALNGVTNQSPLLDEIDNQEVFIETLTAGGDKEELINSLKLKKRPERLNLPVNPIDAIQDKLDRLIKRLDLEIETEPTKDATPAEQVQKSLELATEAKNKVKDNKVSVKPCLSKYLMKSDPGTIQLVQLQSGSPSVTLFDFEAILKIEDGPCAPGEKSKLDAEIEKILSNSVTEVNKAESELNSEIQKDASHDAQEDSDEQSNEENVDSLVEKQRDQEKKREESRDKLQNANEDPDDFLNSIIEDAQNGGGSSVEDLKTQQELLTASSGKNSIKDEYPGLLNEKTTNEITDETKSEEELNDENAEKEGESNPAEGESTTNGQGGGGNGLFSSLGGLVGLLGLAAIGAGVVNKLSSNKPKGGSSFGSLHSNNNIKDNEGSLTKTATVETLVEVDEEKIPLFTTKLPNLGKSSKSTLVNNSETDGVAGTGVELADTAENGGEPNLGNIEKVAGVEYPLIEINKKQFEYDEIKYFKLINSQKFPKIELKVSDVTGVYEKSGAFPQEGDTVDIIIRTNDEFLKNIKAQFEITDIDITGVESGGYGNTEIKIEAILLVKDFFKQKYKIYKKHPECPNDHSGRVDTSWWHLKYIAEQRGLAFASNMGDTDDLQTRHQIMIDDYEFIDETVKSAYFDDKSFLTWFIDPYYTLNYLDINEILIYDKSDDYAIFNMGFNADASKEAVITREDEAKSYETLSGVPYLTNNPNADMTNSFISKHKIIGEGGKIVKKNGYKKNVQFYDWVDKKYEVQTITPLENPNDTALNDTKIWDKEREDERVTNKFVGKLSDNTHFNHQYSFLHNHMNQMDARKHMLKVELNMINLTYYRYQKIPVLIYTSTQKDTDFYRALLERVDENPDEELREFDKKQLEESLKKQEEGNIDPEFLIDTYATGHYTVEGIDIIYKEGRFYQEMMLLRREWPKKYKKEE